MNTQLQLRPYPVLTVGQLTDQIKTILSEEFDFVAVCGEISNAKIHNSGHWYFSLKDQDATIACACFRNQNVSIKFELQDGLSVVARGRIDVFAPRGSYQLIVSQLEPVGIGQWQLAFEQLREKLDKEGLLSSERKRPIPLLPRRIGVVTSPTGAALRDILSALRRRNRNLNVVIAPARVQGEGSAEEVAQAIADLHQVPNVDVIIVARGGGSIEDLWSFNTEVVARAVANSKIPIISGVGHETDITICDLVADLRAPTPTAAAELVSRGHAELQQKWSSLNRFLALGMEQRLQRAQRTLERLNPRHALARQEERLQRLRITSGNLQERLVKAMAKVTNDSQNRLSKQHEKLLALSPVAVLGRGFSILRKEDGQVVQDASQVLPGTQLEALLQHGKLKLQVVAIEKEDWY